LVQFTLTGEAFALECCRKQAAAGAIQSK